MNTMSSWGQILSSCLTKSSKSETIGVQSFGFANCRLVPEPCRRYIPARNKEGSIHCLANQISPAISATLGSSVDYRLSKSLMKLALAR